MLSSTFEMLTLSNIIYGTEFCFDDYLKNLDRVQDQFFKRFCHLKITTSNYTLIGEYGIKPMDSHYYKAALKKWIKIIKSGERSLIRKIYDQINNQIEDKINTKT